MSFRSLGFHYGVSTSTAYRKVLKALKELPDCADITRRYSTNFHGTLIADGKFVKVKSYKDKIPVIYGIDYNTHDIPTYKLTRSEGYINWLKYFESLRLLNYPLQNLVSDDNSNIRDACFRVYPKVVFQLCQKHYKDNVRRSLAVPNNNTHYNFMQDVYELFKYKRREDDFNRFAKNILRKYLRKDVNDQNIIYHLLDIEKRKPDLLGYIYANESLPVTNNLIECYNSHIQGRLKTIKGFETFKHANLWLNAYFVRRRVKPFTSCTGKFKKLNGYSSLQLSSKNREKRINLF